MPHGKDKPTPPANSTHQQPQFPQSEPSEVEVH